MKLDQEALQQIRQVVIEVFDLKFDEAFDRKFDQKFDEAFDRKNKPFAEKLDALYDETCRIKVDVSLLRYEDIPQIKSDLEEVKEILDDHSVKLTRLVRLMPDVKFDLETLQERVAVLERHTGLKKAV
jgi:hypothetical protein